MGITDVADLIICFSYLIVGTSLIIVRARHSRSLLWLFVLLAVALWIESLTHLVWLWPNFFLDRAVRVVCAVSLLAVSLLFLFMLPKVMRIPNVSYLIQLHEQVLEKLKLFMSQAILQSDLKRWGVTLEEVVEKIKEAKEIQEAKKRLPKE